MGLNSKVPKTLRDLLDRRDGQAQQGIAWPRDRWAHMFPSQAVFSRLPPILDRDRVRQACLDATASEGSARNAFLAAMAWGYGNVGYGAWRVAQAFEDRHAGRKLLDVAVALSTDGPQAAYGLMGGASRLLRIGPAFGTKFLYFADLGRHKCRALILDGLVAEWLRDNTAFCVNPVPWAPENYTAYLNQIHEWAEGLGVEPDAVELAIFQEMAEFKGNQWAKPRR